jgi:hypothetical protein
VDAILSCSSNEGIGMNASPRLEEDKDEMQQILEGWARIWFAFSNLTQESLDALGPQALDILQYYQGFSPYADPTTGFEKSYEVKFGSKPTFAECKIYDALMLVAFAASYAEHHADVTDINQAIIAITTPQAQQLRSAAWSQTSMELYLTALEQGQLMDFKGASGEIRFDNETYTSAIHTTYEGSLAVRENGGFAFDNAEDAAFGVPGDIPEGSETA